MREPLEWRLARAGARSDLLGTVGGRLEQAQPVPASPPRGRQFQGGRGHAITVAAWNATDAEKRGATIVCDGEDDDVQILEACSSLGDLNGGDVKLSSGEFVCANPILIPDYVELVGAGRFATILHFDDTDGVGFDGEAAAVRHLGIIGTNASRGVYHSASGLAYYTRVEDVQITSDAVGPSLDLTEQTIVTGCDAFDGRIAIGDEVCFISGCSCSFLDARGYSSVTGCIIYNTLTFFSAGNVAVANLIANVVFDGASSDNMLHSNQCGNLIEIDGDRNEVKNNTSPPVVPLAINILAGSNDALVVFNENASLSDLGSGTRLNYDGSADNWNKN